MTSHPGRKRIFAPAAAVAAAIAAPLLAACSAPHTGAAVRPGGTAHSRTAATDPASPAARRSPPSTAPASTPGIGTLGAFAVRDRWVTFTEPAHTGVTGQHLPSRALLTQFFFPVPRSSPGAGPVKGPLPLVVFGPGFMQCGAPYAKLLRAWATAGYVVAVVNFPRSDCKVGSAATESDMVNQPGDMSYVITRVLALSRARKGFFAGLIDARQVAVTGQSDGGDTVAAVAANTCCTDRRVAAVAVLSGAEWPPMPGQYFTRRPVPLLFTQGSADTINPPGCSVVMYRADPARERFYLDLFGASHTGPYWGVNKFEKVTARVTTAFFDRFVLGQDAAGTAMRRDGSVPGLAALYSAGRGSFPSTYCNT